MSLIKKESFKPNLKVRGGVPYIYWQLVPQERGLITEGSASHSAFRNSGNNVSKPAVWERSALLGKYLTMRSLRYDGAWSLRALYVRRRILNYIPNLTGSQ